MVRVRGKASSVTELVEAGAKRISFSASLCRAAMTGFINAAREAKKKGTFEYLESTMLGPEIYRFFPE
jgi:2-methylisocitrate lyase-like PEP mutase family enzyme